MKFLDSHRFLDASSDKLSTTLTCFPYLDAIGTEDKQFKKKSAYPSEKSQAIESFYEPLNLQTKEFWATLKQSTPTKKWKKRTKTIIDNYNITNKKELTVLLPKKLFEFLQLCFKSI